MKKRYYQFSEYLKDTYGEKVYKITLDAGFSCPNRDGTISNTGCIFCDESGSFSQVHSNTLSVQEQVRTAIDNLPKRFNAQKFMAYFQAYSNTYKKVDELKKIYDDAFCDDRVVSISIGTRPDCLDEEKLDLISTYKNAWLELGLQSTHNRTLEKINRGHDYECFLNAYKMAKKRGIKVCVHMILGLFDETKEEMLQSAKRLGELEIDGIKLHMLTVLEDSPLAKLHEQEKFNFMTMQEYCELAVEFLEYMPKTTSVQRLAASGLFKSLVEPTWVNKKFETLNLIDKIFLEKDTYQGAKFNKS